MFLLQVIKEEKKDITPFPMDLESPHSSELDEEKDAPTLTEKMLPGILREQSPSNIVIGELGALEPYEKVTKSVSDDDKEGPNYILTDNQRE